MTLAHGGGIHFVRIPPPESKDADGKTVRFYQAFTLAGEKTDAILKVEVEDEVRMRERKARIPAAFLLPLGNTLELLETATRLARGADVARDDDDPLTGVYQQIRLYDRIVKPISGRQIIAPETLDKAGDALTAIVHGSPVPTTAPHSVPAAYTYFGQFLAHDMSWMKLDHTLPLDGTGADTGWTNGRHGHALSFDTLFGTLPPSSTPTRPWHKIAGAALGLTSGDEELALDLPRAGTRGISCTPDLRTDTNLALAQMHVLLVRFHMAGWDLLGGSDADAQRRTRDHLQAVVLTDYLPRIIPCDIYDDVIAHGRKIVAPWQSLAADYTFELPVEFAAACFRFGHSVVNEPYRNWIIKYPPDGSTLPNKPAYIENLFYYTEKQGGLQNGRLEFYWAQFWRHMVENSNSSLPPTVKAEAIRAALKPAFGSLETSQFPPDSTIAPVPQFNLAKRTLQRGEALGLPSGQRLHQAVFDALGDTSAQPLDVAKFLADRPARFANLANETAFCEATPLWFYVLAEAEDAETGKLGPVAARVVMETIHAALEFAPDSIISVDEQGVTKNDFRRAYRIEKGPKCEFCLTDVVALAYGDVDASI